MQQNFHILIGLFAGLCAPVAAASTGEKPEAVAPPAPVKVLLISGGSSHDFVSQVETLRAGINARVSFPIAWTVELDRSGRSDLQHPFFGGDDWAAGYDLVIHHYCYPRVKDPDSVERILRPHRSGTPALLIHGTLQSFRTGDERWFEFCGAETRSHADAGAVTVAPESSGGGSWTSPREELYLLEDLRPGVEVIAEGSLSSLAKPEPVAWQHRFGPAKTKVFATSLGNHISDETPPEYFDLLARGMLWALEKSTETDLVPLDVPAPPAVISEERGTPALVTGYSHLQTGKASALSSRAVDGALPQLAVDGLSATFWQADAPGPSVWSIELPEVRRFGALVIEWQATPPLAYQIEGSVDSLTWTTLASGPRKASQSATSVHSFASREILSLRVTFPQTRPGEFPAIREIAAFRSVDEIPAAYVKLAATDGLLSLGDGPTERGIRLAPDWTVGPRSDLEGDGRFTELSPRADGGVFVIREGDAGNSIIAVAPVRGEAFEAVSFLDGIERGASMTWDGEWVYLLEGRRLSRLRDTNDDGIADERKRLGEIDLPPAERAGLPFSVSHLQLSIDGWIYGVIHGSDSARITSSDGRLVELPAYGIVRFRRDGSGLQPFVSSTDPVVGLRITSDFKFIVSSQDGAGRTKRHVVEYGVFPGRPLDSFPLSDDSERNTIREGDQIFSLSGGAGERELLAEFRGLDWVIETDCGLWITFQRLGGSSLVHLSPSGKPRGEAASVDNLKDLQLFPLLSSPVPLIRKEAVFEILRRKRDWKSEALALLQDQQSPSYPATLALLSQMEGIQSFELLANAAKLSHQAAPFRLLGDHEEARNHGVFREIMRSTEPAVTTEILAAIARSGSEITGLDALVFGFAKVDDETLSTTAREWLIQREASDLCLEVIEAAKDKESVVAAFSVLARIPKPTVAEGIVRLMEHTSDPDFRNAGLDTLCQLYFLPGGNEEVWSGTVLIDSFLRASLTDRRVDSRRLLDEMLSRGIPLTDLTDLTSVAADQLPLQAATVELLLTQDEPPENAVPWLEVIAGDESHTPDLQAKASALLLGRAATFSEAFSLLTEASSRALLPGTAQILQERWLRRNDWSGQTNFLLSKFGSSDETVAGLAGKGLRHLLSLPTTDNSTRTRIAAALSPDGGTTPQGGEYELGYGVFRKFHCGQCHNIHGEGPSFAPDLVDLATTVSTRDFVQSVLMPDEAISDEFRTSVIEWRDGRRLRGIVTRQEEDFVQLTDRAGNEITLPASEIRLSWQENDSIMPDHYGGVISKREIETLLIFLRELGAGPSS